MSGVLGRIVRDWRALSSEQRLAAIAAILLLLSMLLPWYQETGNAIVGGKLARIDDSKSAFGVYSFVEAAIFVVVVGTIALLWARAERKAFHLPGGDGTIILVAGAWAALLIVWRLFDKPGVSGSAKGATIGLQWGIFVALIAAGILAWTGARLRAAHRPEPPLRPRRPEPPPGEPVEVHIPDDRPHLEETKVMPEREAPTEEAPRQTDKQPRLPGLG
jgi:hypothetical protein